MSYQQYYVPEQSKFPIFVAIALFLLVMGAAGTINDLDKLDSKSVYVLYAGFAVLATTLFFWFRTVIAEHIAGLDSAQLQKSFVFGMGWFIFSEVMFFGAFFWRTILCKKFFSSLAWRRRREGFSKYAMGRIRGNMACYVNS